MTLSRNTGIGLAAVSLMAWMSACDPGRADRSVDTPPPRAVDSTATYQAEVEEGLGAAVAILIDTSGSMRDKAPGDARPKSVVAREIFRKSEGAVQVYFVAFDTSPQKFAFLKEVGGDVIGAGTGAELRQALDGIYQGKILAEAPGAGEREPVKP